MNRFVPIALGILLAACSADSGDSQQADANVEQDTDASSTEIPSWCVDEDRADTYEPGMVRTGEAGYDITLIASVPGPPKQGDSAWELLVEDPDDNPVDGLTIKAVPFMPDHGHGTGVVAVPEARGDGVYGLGPVNLFMPGLWAVKIRLFQEDTELDSATFRFCL